MSNVRFHASFSFDLFAILGPFCFHCVRRDAVELPSQFMENFLYDADVLRLCSAHVETGAPLPDALLAKLRAAKNHHAALALLRQLHFALTDLRLHDKRDAARFANAFALERDQATKTTVDARLSDARFLCAFSHIFAGGYSAGYYSYKWAEVLSADAFGAFHEAQRWAVAHEAATRAIVGGAPGAHVVDGATIAAGVSDRKWSAWARLGRRFRDTVLASGGAVSPATVFEAFRGRAPSPDALLEAAGLQVAVSL